MMSNHFDLLFFQGRIRTLAGGKEKPSGNEEMKKRPPICHKPKNNKFRISIP